jgi:hypothetical protein
MRQDLRRWQERTRMLWGHHLSRPFYRLFKRVPHWESGLASYEVTRLPVPHRLLGGRRAVHLSDLHIDSYLPRHDRAVGTVGDLNPDWIFITGDLLNIPDGLPHLFRFLGKLRSFAPVFLTLGNHDHYSGVPLDEFREQADRHKVTLLVNEATFIQTESGELAIAGVDDPSLHRADLRCIPSAARHRYTLLLAHAPNILDQLHAHHEVDLILCGHSHGGQWRFPGVPTVWLPPGCNGRLDGHHRKNGRKMYVNRGLGWSMLPLRVNCRPEIAVIEWTNEPVVPAAKAA